MRLYYYRCKHGNFGDDLNPWLWGKLIPELLDDDGTTLFVGVGTILNRRIPVEPAKVVFGAGTGYGDHPLLTDAWDFRCVRGPLTAEALGLDPALAITDAAMLLATVNLPPVQRDGGLAFMPHHDSALNADWEMVCRHLNIRYIDPSAGIEKVMYEIRRSESLVAEAMHGAIVADTFRVPWTAVSCYDHILDFKWRDWCSSLGLTYRAAQLPGIWHVDRNAPRLTRFKNSVKRSLRAAGLMNANWTPPPPPRSSRQRVSSLIDQLSEVLKNGEFTLSHNARFETAVARLETALVQMKRDYAGR